MVSGEWIAGVVVGLWTVNCTVLVWMKCRLMDETENFRAYYWLHGAWYPEISRM
jgi:hypothetical protein